MCRRTGLSHVLQVVASFNSRAGVDLAISGVMTQKDRKKVVNLLRPTTAQQQQCCPWSMEETVEGLFQHAKKTESDLKREWKIGRMAATQKIPRKGKLVSAIVDWHLTSLPLFLHFPLYPRNWKAKQNKIKQTLHLLGSLAGRGLSALQVLPVGDNCMRHGREAFLMSLWCPQESSPRCVYWLQH